MYRRLVRWSSRTSCRKAPPAVPSTIRVSSRSSLPGTLRVTKGYGAEKHEAELDSTLARIIGSDWGDRSRQPVSLPMRIYWVVFTLVLGNGLYTYFTGKDESFLVEKLKKTADEKLGISKEENEIMADGLQKDSSSGGETRLVQAREEKLAVMAPPTMLNARAVPFVVPGVSVQSTARHSTSKKDLEQQLVQLRVQQKRLQKQICTGEEVAKDELEHQVRMIDIQKEQVKLQIKRL